MLELNRDWYNLLYDEFERPYFIELMDFLDAEYDIRKKEIYPERSNIFNALNLTPFEDVKVVIIGQDPYHNPGQANGLAFSVPDKCAIPPSLRNVYKELGIESDSGNLEGWAKQGVLLLNSILTVEKNKPLSHAEKGWEIFTDEIIELLNYEKSKLVFMLWGKYAQEKGKVIDRTRHLVLEAPHPSPFSAYKGFLGCGHFEKCNKYLKEPVNWTCVNQKSMI